MLSWIRRRRRSSKFRLRLITDTIDTLDFLHQRADQIEAQLRELQATSQALENTTARAEAQASAARLEVRDFIEEFSANHETHDDGSTRREATPKVQQQPELLDSLMPILTPIGSRAVTLGGPADSDPSHEGDEHLLLVPTPEGYELLERPGGAPAAGSVVDLGGGWRGEVVKVVRSPLPGDRRRCAYLQQAAATSTVEEDTLRPALVGSS